jgi:hypothetical protein
LPARAEIERFLQGLGCVPFCAHPLRLRSVFCATQGRHFGREFLRDTYQTSYSFGALHR